MGSAAHVKAMLTAHGVGGSELATHIHKGDLGIITNSVMFSFRALE